VQNLEEESKITTKEDLIREFKGARGRVVKSIAGLSHEDMKLPTSDSGVTVKDILAHFIEWDRLEIERTGRFFADEKIDMAPDEDNDAFNQKAFLKWKDKDVGEVVVAFYEYTDRVQKLLERLYQQQLFADKGLRFTQRKDGHEIEHIVNPAWLLVETDHDRSHAREIEQWRREMGIDEHQQTT